MHTTLLLSILLAVAIPAFSLPNQHPDPIKRAADPLITPPAIYHKRSVDSLLQPRDHPQKDQQQFSGPFTACPSTPGLVQVEGGCCTTGYVYNDAQGRAQCCNEHVFEGKCGDFCDDKGLAVLPSGQCCEKAHIYQMEGVKMCCTAQVVDGRCTSNGG